MATKLKPKTTAPEAVVHAALELPPQSYKEGVLDDKLTESILLKTQGEAVEISEEYPIQILMAVFDIVHKVSPEMVLRLKTGERVLLFDHWGAPVIRDKDILKLARNEARHQKSTRFTTEVVIDVENIWRKYGGAENNLNTISKSLKEVSKSIKPAMITTLVGKAPALLFLLSQHLLYGKTGEIWYQEKQTSPPIRITSL